MLELKLPTGAAAVTRLKVVCCGLPSWHMVTLPSFDDGTKESARYHSLRRSSIRFAGSILHRTTSGERREDIQTYYDFLCGNFCLCNVDETFRLKNKPCLCIKLLHVVAAFWKVVI